MTPRVAGPRVAGLDLSLSGTGVAMTNGGTFTVGGPSTRGDRRLLDIVTAIHEALIEPPDLVVIEGLMTHSIGAGSQAALVHGAVRLYLVQQGYPYALVPPSTLKAYATGNGGAKTDKHAMRMAAYKRTRIEFTDDNQCDAWWLRQAGLDHLGHPELPLPAAQRDRLTKVVWPALPTPLETP